MSRAHRYQFIDWVRGVAIVGVIVIHATIYVRGWAPLRDEARFVSQLFRFAVPCFFGVLGFMTVVRYTAVRAWRRFFGTKLLTVVFPFLCWALIYTYNPGLIRPSQPEFPLPIRVLLGYVEPHLYFVVAYVGFLMLTPGVVAGVRWLGARHKIAAACLAITAAHIAVLVWVQTRAQAGLDENFYLRTDSRLPLHWISSYALGVLLALYRDELADSFARARRRWLLAGFLALPIQLWIAARFIGDPDPYVFHDSAWMVAIAVTAVFVLAALWGLLRGSRLDRAVQYLGKNSFPIYLSHMLFMEAAAYALRDGAIDPRTRVAVAFGASVLGALLYARVHNRIFAKPRG